MFAISKQALVFNLQTFIEHLASIEIKTSLDFPDLWPPDNNQPSQSCTGMQQFSSDEQLPYALNNSFSSQMVSQI